MGNYNDALLEQLADQGDGFYAYVNDLDEARRLFSEDLTATLQTVALDAKVQVEFDPDRRRRLPARRLREPRRRRRGLPRPGGRRRRDRRGPRGDRAVRASPARRIRETATASARSACAGPTRTIEPGPATHRRDIRRRRPVAIVRADGPALQARRHRRGDGRGRCAASEFASRPISPTSAAWPMTSADGPPRHRPGPRRSSSCSTAASRLDG